MASGTVNVTSIAVTPPCGQGLATFDERLARLGTHHGDDSASRMRFSERSIAAHRLRFLEELDQIIGNDGFDEVMIETGFLGSGGLPLVRIRRSRSRWRP